MMKLLFLAVICLSLTLGMTHEAKLDDFLQKHLSSSSSSSSSEPLSLFIFPFPAEKTSLPSSTQEELSSLRAKITAPLSSIPRPQKRQAVFEERSLLAHHSQESLLSLLSSKGLPFIRSFWISNSIYVRGASLALLEELRHHPLVREIRGEYPIAFVPPLVEEQDREKGKKGKGEREAVEWNIAQIGADAAWNITRGEGVVVGIIDTGVRETHEALLGSYRGNDGSGSLNHDYNWFDPKEFRFDPWWCIPTLCSPQECCMDTPFDPIGHGTHVCGTAVGSEEFGIGVAPGAKWIAAKGCKDGNCMNYGLTTSAEWILCPTKLDGSSPDCTKGADIISNSWGGTGGDDWYKEYTLAWTEAGMIPVFSQGNSGPRCETLGSPGDYDEVIGVAASDSKDSLADFSSRGPADGSSGFSSSKPQITAPGVSIRSASSTVGSSDNQKYSVSSGTSMAAPHISGVLALILSANPSLGFEEVVDLLGKTANKNVGPPDNGRTGSDVCGGRSYDDLPSFHYGEGIVDAYAAVQAAFALRK